MGGRLHVYLCHCKHTASSNLNLISAGLERFYTASLSFTCKENIVYTKTGLLLRNSYENHVFSSMWAPKTAIEGNNWEGIISTKGFPLPCPKKPLRKPEKERPHSSAVPSPGNSKLFLGFAGVVLQCCLCLLLVLPTLWMPQDQVPFIACPGKILLFLFHLCFVIISVTSMHYLLSLRCPLP